MFDCVATLALEEIDKLKLKQSYPSSWSSGTASKCRQVLVAIEDIAKLAIARLPKLTLQEEAIGGLMLCLIDFGGPTS